MGEKRGRAEANGDEQQAPTDEDTRRTEDMTRRQDGERSETLSQKGAALASSNHKREIAARRQAETQSDANRREATAE